MKENRAGAACCAAARVLRPVPDVARASRATAVLHKLELELFEGRRWDGGDRA